MKNLLRSTLGRAIRERRLLGRLAIGSLTLLRPLARTAVTIARDKRASRSPHPSNPEGLPASAPRSRGGRMVSAARSFVQRHPAAFAAVGEALLAAALNRAGRARGARRL